VLNVIARTRDKETVLILEWSRGTFLALHGDGRMAEYPINALRADLLEAQMRIASNIESNAELFAEVAEH
jgi:hypothetical protein